MKTSNKISMALLIVASFCAFAAFAQTPASLSADDRSAIQKLTADYLQALSGCHAEQFADLFVPDGYFASGFRGHFVGRKQLILLVQSERHCTAPAGSAQATRPGGANVPTVAIEATPGGVRGVADLGGQAEYQDEYAKTPQGWRFASRSVLIAAEKAAGLGASDLLAIHRLGGDKLGDHYVTDQSGVQRLMNVGVQLTVKDGEVTGRAYLKDGGYDDQVYEKLAPGQWRAKSSTHVPAEAR